MSTYSEACCKLPPVVSSGYSVKGEYTSLDGVKTYVTGPKDADTAILMIYDVFGFKDQILQGADILAEADSEKKYQVYMPDFFNGDYAPLEWYPPDTEEKKAKLGEWFKIATPTDHAPRVPGFLKEAEKQNSNIKTWAVVGYCWGTKLVTMLAAEGYFKVGVQTSPAMIEPEEAKKIKIPMALLASKDEPVDDLDKYVANLTVSKHFETFDKVPHGFMSAKADLDDPIGKSEYERGYHITLKFFHDNL